MYVMTDFSIVERHARVLRHPDQESTWFGSGTKPPRFPMFSLGKVGLGSDETPFVFQV